MDDRLKTADRRLQTEDSIKNAVHRVIQSDCLKKQTQCISYRGERRVRRDFIDELDAVVVKNCQKMLKKPQKLTKTFNNWSKSVSKNQKTSCFFELMQKNKPKWLRWAQRSRGTQALSDSSTTSFLWTFVAMCLLL